MIIAMAVTSQPLSTLTVLNLINVPPTIPKLRQLGEPNRVDLRGDRLPVKLWWTQRSIRGEKPTPRDSGLQNFGLWLTAGCSWFRVSNNRRREHIRCKVVPSGAPDFNAPFLREGRFCCTRTLPFPNVRPRNSPWVFFASGEDARTAGALESGLRRPLPGSRTSYSSSALLKKAET
jgi:hypothetical protein